MSDANDQKWGEDKIILEEAVGGGFMSAAASLAIVSVFASSQTIQNIASFNLGLTEIIYILIPVFAYFCGFYLMGFQKSSWFFSGMEYISSQAQGVYTLRKRERKLMSADQKAGKVKGIVVGEVELSRTRQVGHVFVVGLPGAGKTVLINAMMVQAMDAGDKLVLHDPKGDATSFLYDEKDTVMLGPWDARASCIDISSDVKTPELATSIAKAWVLSGQKEGSGGGSKFFEDAATEVIAGLMHTHMRDEGDNWSWDSLAEDLRTGGVELIEKSKQVNQIVSVMLASTESEGKGLSNMVQSVLATVAVATAWIPSYAASFDIKRDANGRLIRDNLFSVQGWVAKTHHNNVRKLILNNDKNYEARGKAIFGAVFSLMASYVNSSKMPEVGADAEGFFVMLDEHPQLGAGSHLAIQEMQELGRSRGVRTVLAVQDYSQLMASAGREKGEAQRSVQQTTIFCKTSLNTGDEASRRLGQAKFVRIEFPLVVGAGNKRAVYFDSPAVPASEFTGLEVLKEPNKNGKTGVEMIIFIDDLLIKTVQPFMPRELVAEIHPKVVINTRWERGILDINNPVIEKAKMAEQQFNAVSAAIDKTTEDLEDDDLYSAEDVLATARELNDKLLNEVEVEELNVPEDQDEDAAEVDPTDFDIDFMISHKPKDTSPADVIAEE